MTTSDRAVVSPRSLHGDVGRSAVTSDSGETNVKGRLPESFPAVRGGANSASQLPTHRVLPDQSQRTEAMKW